MSHVTYHKNVATILVSWAAVLLCMVMIFLLSSQTAYRSNKLSEGISIAIAETIAEVSPHKELNVETLNRQLRKNAHFFAFLLLGVLVIHALWRSGVPGRKRTVIALFICILYAVTDEFHQLFIPGRGAQIADVLIDSAGAITGVAIFQIAEMILRRIS